MNEIGRWYGNAAGKIYYSEAAFEVIARQVLCEYDDKIYFGALSPSPKNVQKSR